MASSWLHDFVNGFTDPPFYRVNTEEIRGISEAQKKNYKKMTPREDITVSMILNRVTDYNLYRYLVPS